MLLLAATALGFIYTAAMEKGLFASRQPADTLSLPSSRNAPVMISRDQAKAYFDGGDALFIDSRHEFDYKLGHIKGAINLPLNEYNLKMGALVQLPREKLIVIYCDGADCNSSIELSARLFADGFLSVKIFFGGWGEWKAQNLPIEKSTR
jgi:rhodanese-related sulfurtransferase